MSITFQALSGQLRMDVSQWNSGITQAKGGLSGLLSHVNGVSNAIASKLNQIGVALSGLSIGGLAAASKAIKLASDAEEAASKFQYVFKTAADQTRRSLDEFAKSAGRSRYELRGMAADFGALLGPMGIGDKELGKMSVQLSRLTVDLSSFFNVTEKEAATALRAGIVGESEPLRRLGVNISAVKIEREAARLGLVKMTKSMAQSNSESVALAKAEQRLLAVRTKYGTNSLKFAEALTAVQRAEEKLGKQSKISVEQLDPAIKARAIYSLILRETKQAQGDAERTGGSFANQLRRLQATVNDLAVDLGGPLMSAAKVTIGMFNKLLETNQKAILGFAKWLEVVLSAENVERFWNRMIAGGLRAWAVIKQVAAVVTPLVKTLASWWDRLPDVLKFVAAISGLATAMTTVGNAVPLFGAPLAMIGKLINPLGNIVPLLTKAVPWLLRLAMGLGPIGWIAAGLTAAFSAIIYFLSTSATFGPQVERIWTKLRDLITKGWDAIVKLFGGLAESLENLVDVDWSGFWESLKTGAEDALKVVLNAFEGIIDFLSGRGTQRIEAAWLQIASKIKMALGKLVRDAGRELGLSGLEDAGSRLVVQGANDDKRAFQLLAEAQLRDDAEAAAKQAQQNDGRLMTPEERAQGMRAGGAGVLRAAGGAAPIMRIGTKTGIRPFFGQREIDPLTASRDQLISAATRGRSFMQREMRANSENFQSRSERDAASRLAAAAQDANRAVANAAPAEREAALAKAQEAFDAWRGFLDSVKQRGDALRGLEEAEQGNDAAIVEEATKKAANASAAVTEQLSQFEKTKNEKRQAHLDEMERRRTEYENRRKKDSTDKAADEIENAGEKAADAIEGAGDDVAGAMTEAEKARQDAQYNAWAKEQDRTVDAFGPLRNALNDFGNGVQHAANVIGMSFGREAKLYEGLTPEQQLQSLLNKKTQELQGAEMNMRFLNRGFGFGGVTSLSDQSRNMSTQQTRINNLRADIASIQRQLSSGQGGVAAMGSPDVKGGMSAADAIRGGTAGQGFGNTYGDTNTSINMTVNTQQVDAGKLFDQMEAESKKRGVDATGRSPLRKQARGPINSRIR